MIDLIVVGNYLQFRKSKKIDMLNDEEKNWVMDEIGSLTGSDGEVYVKEMYKNIVTKKFKHRKIVRTTCKTRKKNLKP